MGSFLVLSDISITVSVFHLICICLPLPTANFPRLGPKVEIEVVSVAVSLNSAPEIMNPRILGSYWKFRFCGFTGLWVWRCLSFGWGRKWTIFNLHYLLLSRLTYLEIHRHFEELMWCWWAPTLAPRCELSLKLVNILSSHLPKKISKRCQPNHKSQQHSSDSSEL